MSIRILLVDDHRALREGIRALIHREPDMQVVAEAGSGETAVKLSQELEPDVVVTDIGFADQSGVEVARQITNANARIRVIGLSLDADSRFVSEMLEAGASAYLLKDRAFEEMSRAIRAVLENKTFLGAGVSCFGHCGKRRLPGHQTVSQTPGGALIARLTEREREILALVADGKTVKEMAAHCAISKRTVENHRRNIRQKLGIKRVADLVKFAIREGLSGLDS